MVDIKSMAVPTLSILDLPFSDADSSPGATAMGGADPTAPPISFGAHPRRAMALVALLAFLFLCPFAAIASPQVDERGAAVREVDLDRTGVIRWRDSQEEVALFGANYCLMSGSDYRMAGRVSTDRKAMIDEDMAQFARMGFTALRLCSWGDWENSDRDGNLIVNEHVDLLDYLIAKARERGIYLLLTPIHTYNPAWPDEAAVPTKNIGFSRYFDRDVMGTDPRSIAAQSNYIRQLLNHINPYTHAAIKNEPALLFIEMINEPVHHPKDLSASISYIDTLVKAVRDTGCRKLTFFNVSQDFAIAPAIKRSQVDGITFGWYPTSLVAGHTLKGNFLQAVDAYPGMLTPELKNKPRIVYEFDQADLLSGYLYPAMARTFRSVGGQFATMFAYDMLQTAPYNLGWQTHYLNLVHTPRKALSAMIAAEAMRRLPRMQSYGRYPDSTRFGDFRVSYENDASELNADDAFMNAGDTQTAPRNIRALQRIAGFGSSPLVDYEGTGAYFLDKIGDGVWRLEVYPDEVLIRDPFEPPQPGQVVSRLLYRAWPMTLHLPDLGNNFFARPLGGAAAVDAAPRRAERATLPIEPGVWLLSVGDRADLESLPSQVSRVGLREYHINQKVSYPDLVLPLAAKEYPAGEPAVIRVRVADDTLPDEVDLWLRAAGTHDFGKALIMQRTRGNDYAATLPAAMLPAGNYQYAVTVKTSERVTTFPDGYPRQPADWPLHTGNLWSLRVIPAGTALRLFDPKVDYASLSFVRPGEQYRTPFFHLIPGESDDESALSLEMPDLGKDTPERYAAALYVGESIAARKSDMARAETLSIQLRAVQGAQRNVEVTLIEQDGTAWSTSIVAHAPWERVQVALREFKNTRSIHIPSPYPGLWNYWREGAAHRGAAGDHLRADQIERLQLTVTPNGADADAQGIAIESIQLLFASAQAH